MLWGLQCGKIAAFFEDVRRKSPRTSSIMMSFVKNSRHAFLHFQRPWDEWSFWKDHYFSRDSLSTIPGDYYFKGRLDLQGINLEKGHSLWSLDLSKKRCPSSKSVTLISGSVKIPICGDLEVVSRSGLPDLPRLWSSINTKLPTEKGKTSKSWLPRT